MVDRKGNGMNTKYEAFQRLNDIFEEMNALISEVESLTRSEFPYEYENARAYWIGHIKSALGNHNYPTYSTTFESALRFIDEEMNEMEEV